MATASRAAAATSAAASAAAPSHHSRAGAAMAVDDRAAGEEAPFAGKAVFPGDDVSGDIPESIAVVKLGTGLSAVGDKVVVTKAGFLEFRAPNRFFVLSTQKRYAPAVGDMVIGIVTDKNADFYRLKVHGTTTATLPTLAFDGATKRNKPSLAIGTPVFARVVSCSRYMDVELTCQVADGPKKDWMTGQSLLGELRGGTLTRVTLGTARRLLDPDNPLLVALGEVIPFEVAVGVNGVVYVRAGSVRETVAVSMAVQRCEHLTDLQCRVLADRLVAALKAAAATA